MATPPAIASLDGARMPNQSRSSPIRSRAPRCTCAHGGHVAPVAYEPTLRGVLLTGGSPRFLRHTTASSVPSAASERRLWSAPGKVADGRVARYLAAHERFRVAAAG